MTQERTASPSTWTVQAPHSDDPAAELGPGEAEGVAEHPEQRGGRIGLHGSGSPVQDERHLGHVRTSKDWGGVASFIERPGGPGKRYRSRSPRSSCCCQPMIAVSGGWRALSVPRLTRNRCPSRRDVVVGSEPERERRQAEERLRLGEPELRAGAHLCDHQVVVRRDEEQLPAVPAPAGKRPASGRDPLPAPRAVDRGDIDLGLPRLLRGERDPARVRREPGVVLGRDAPGERHGLALADHREKQDLLLSLPRR